ncbi:putative Jasmonic acid-amido synthetase JAR1 [Cocos nucifera]|uniref:Putative Jasmonic acid-amido synthetase JAR1 n=1 Tax=Cocos nucifera TaxID=13894 RepID=A0A8K0IA17_COCNU|nr:putative Jasmonic acid-amido synthetase JAR1 [Cocos nucifera]
MTVFSMESVIEEFETLTKDADRVQRETLRKILKQNGEAEYLQQFGLEGRTDPETFKACVPLVTHQDLEPYIQRIFDGDTSPVLTGKPLTAITVSSGTAQGKRKFFPFNEELLQSTVQIYRISFAFRNREYPIGNGKALQFIYSSMEMKTNGGLTAAAATTNIYRSGQFKRILKDIKSQCCSPDEVIFCPHSDQSLYCHLLCGLIYSDEVQWVFAQFAHSLVNAFRAFELIWEDLCNDIRHGVLSSRITVPFVRAAVSKLLFPNRTLADSIYKKCLGLYPSGSFGEPPT